MGRGYGEYQEVYRAQALNNSGVTRFSKDFPLGEGWHRMDLYFNVAVTIGTGAGVVAESLLKYIKAITLKTSRGEKPYDNVPGRLAYFIDRVKRGTSATLPSVAAASATYKAMLTLWFSDPLALREQDTILDTARYSGVELAVQLGSISDLYSAPGTATVATTLDIYIERTRGPIPTKVRPGIFNEFGLKAPQDPNTILPVDLERAQNLAYRRLYMHTSSSPTAGEAFSGTNSDSVLADVKVEHDGGTPFQTVLWTVLGEANKQDYALETTLTGYRVVDFLRADRSLQAALYSGDKSRLRVVPTLGSVNPGQLTVGYEASKPLI